MGRITFEFKNRIQTSRNLRGKEIMKDDDELEPTELEEDSGLSLPSHTAAVYPVHMDQGNSRCSAAPGKNLNEEDDGCLSFPRTTAPVYPGQVDMDQDDMKWSAPPGKSLNEEDNGYLSLPRTTAPVYPGQVDINEDDIIGKILNEEGNVRPGNMPASVEQDEPKEEDELKEEDKLPSTTSKPEALTKKIANTSSGLPLRKKKIKLVKGKKKKAKDTESAEAPIDIDNTDKSNDEVPAGKMPTRSSSSIFRTSLHPIRSSFVDRCLNKHFAYEESSSSKKKKKKKKKLLRGKRKKTEDTVPTEASTDTGKIAESNKEAPVGDVPRRSKFFMNSLYNSISPEDDRGGDVPRKSAFKQFSRSNFKKSLQIKVTDIDKIFESNVDAPVGDIQERSSPGVFISSMRSSFWERNLNKHGSEESSDSKKKKKKRKKKLPPRERCDWSKL